LPRAGDAGEGGAGGQGAARADVVRVLGGRSWWRHGKSALPAWEAPAWSTTDAHRDQGERKLATASGEVVALRRESVDLARGVLIVDRSVSDVAGQLMLGPTKTGRVRAVPIPDTLVPDLLDPLARRVGSEPASLPFTSEAGGLVSHAYWYKSHFRPAVKRAGLPEGLRYHDLRHTYASLLIAEGAHPRAIMERLGHSSIQVTLGTYGHLFPTLDEALTGRLASRIAAARRELFGTDLARNGQCRKAIQKQGV
jgi:hypothetical protein